MVYQEVLRRHMYVRGATNADIGTSYEDVWNESIAYPFPTAVQNLTVSSDDANDTIAGTGAQKVGVIYLDADYEEQFEEISLNGTTGVALAVPGYRVNGVYVTQAGSSLSNEGKIYVGYGSITSGKPANTLATIFETEGGTMLGVFTVPAGQTYRLMRLEATGDATNANRINVLPQIRELGGAFVSIFKVILAAQGREVDLSSRPFILPAKSDIRVRANSVSGTRNLSILYLLEGN